MSHRPPSTENVTRLLQAWNRGDSASLDRLMSVVYLELRRLAEGYMRRQPPGHTLQTTGLVHEAYLRLLDQASVDWQGRAHFFGVAAKAMRSILIDHARRQRALKRGGKVCRPTLGAAGDVAVAGPSVDVLELDEALARLAALDSRKSQVVELRYFAGLELEEIAAVLDISLATVKRDWTAARAWLRRELKDA